MVGGVAFSFKNYSPTASVDGESLFHGMGSGRQALTQSAVLSPSRLDESLNSGHVDPLSQSVRVESTAPQASGGSPIKRLHVQHSFRNKLGRIFGIFQREEFSGEEHNFNEEFIELFASDANLRRGGGGVVGGKEEMGQEVFVPAQPETVAMEIEGRSLHSTSIEGSGEDKSDSPDEDSHRHSGVEGGGMLLEGVGGQLGEIDLSTLPPVSRPSRSNSDASQTSTEQPYNFRDSPNTAGAGHFDCIASGQSYTEVGASISTTAVNPRMSSSYPRSAVSRVSEEGVGGGRRRGRAHASNSETEMSSHAQRIQEKLQKLVEHKEFGGLLNEGESAEVKGHEDDGFMDSQTPVLVSSGGHNHPPPEGGMAAAVTAPPPPLQGHTLHQGFAMRRLSVCSWRGVGQRLISDSSSGGAATVTGGSQSGDPRDPRDPPLSASVLMNSHPSPLALLDQFVRCGEVVHRGRLDTIPLTEQEGVDWNHFGGCPHSEEFRIMQSQVVLLHSQLLFERYQCVQHAKRNRRLLSKARSAAHVTEELVSLVSAPTPSILTCTPILSLYLFLVLLSSALSKVNSACVFIKTLVLFSPPLRPIQRDQLHQRDVLVGSLQRELSKVAESRQSVSRQQLQEREEEGRMARENAKLKDDNARLSEELWRMAEKNRKLEEVCTPFPV